MEPLKRARAAFLPGKRSAGPDPGAGRPEVAGIDIHWLFESSIVRLNRWHCRETATGLTGEREQFWRVIGFVHAGAYELLSPRGTVLVDPIKVAFLNPFEAYRTRHPCGCGDHGSSLIVREDVLREIVARRRPDLGDSAAGLFPKPAGPCPNGAFLRHRSLLRRLEAGEGTDPLQAEETALGVAAEIVAAALAPRRHRPLPPRRSHHRDLAEDLRRLLGRRFREPVRLAGLSRELGTSPFHLCRVFREETGLSIHGYLTRLRLRSAVEALARGEKDLSGLAFDLGFSSHSHFAHSFRREFGFPPSAFRRSRSDALGAGF
jgi:AraC-like DNA-binding protein